MTIRVATEREIQFVRDNRKKTINYLRQELKAGREFILKIAEENEIELEPGFKSIYNTEQVEDLMNKYYKLLTNEKLAEKINELDDRYNCSQSMVTNLAIRFGLKTNKYKTKILIDNNSTEIIDKKDAQCYLDGSYYKIVNNRAFRLDAHNEWVRSGKPVNEVRRKIKSYGAFKT